MQSSSVSRLLNVHPLLPERLLQATLGRALRGVRLALCLHRVKFDTNPTLIPSATTSAVADLDALISLLLSACPRNESGWLTISFDDGYRDAAEYVTSRCSRWPSVRWIVFVCPRKLAARAGFRWDLPANATHRDPFAGAYDIAAENLRSDLRGLADAPECRLASVEECQRLAELSGVTLGNHTNCHFLQTGLSLADAKQDLLESKAEFEQLFGQTREFAFPFGTPRSQFTEEHVALARAAGYEHIWSTEPRPHAIAELGTGRALPRVAIFGDWPMKKTAVYLALRALKYQVRVRRKAKPDGVDKCA